jgi:glucose-6-phosphate isomerase, archaeal
MEGLISRIKKRGKIKKVFLSELKEFLKDKKKADEILTLKNPLVYEVKSIEENEISYGLTLMNPGKVGKEYFMTKGHVHKNLSSETYYLLSGKATLILKKGKETIKVPMKKDFFHYIPQGYAHRVINNGNVPALFLSVYQTDSKPDYAGFK